MPGWGTGSVGYHTDDGGIFCNSIKSETKGTLKKVKPEIHSKSWVLTV